ncbi:hypothetical protein J5X98_15420 [Leptothermofonsia sichuanensis E412]|uniref:hypothetical protein n=1 Tax=Leptothermofonsia sichuanensis TaxID=2917832 RepID=UPI001CA63E8D|nr:hypothetical protein [Leptothermofonsia sichuanensis]QZZ18843.1 hypothetical protein J5X98_15420 [Leptothermofonsia sichuanensis E412]
MAEPLLGGIETSKLLFPLPPALLILGISWAWYELKAFNLQAIRHQPPLSSTIG